MESYQTGTEHVSAVARDHACLAYALHDNCYLNITSRCTLRCQFCPKFNGEWEVQGYPLRLKQDPAPREILAALGNPLDYEEVVFCGLGEPTLRLDTLLQVAAKLKKQGARVRINTDGLANLVHGRDVTPELARVVDAVSISLNGQNEEVYNRHCRPQHAGSFEAAQEFARLARRQGMQVTLTAIDGLAGLDIQACRNIADELEVGFRRRVLDVVG